MLVLQLEEVLEKSFCGIVTFQMSGLRCIILYKILLIKIMLIKIMRFRVYADGFGHGPGFEGQPTVYIKPYTERKLQ